jgi:hypothetical protein
MSFVFVPVLCDCHNRAVAVLQAFAIDHWLACHPEWESKVEAVLRDRGIWTPTTRFGSPDESPIVSLCATQIKAADWVLRTLHDVYDGYVYHAYYWMPSNATPSDLTAFLYNPCLRGVPRAPPNSPALP